MAGLGGSVPAWLSDFSNGLMVESNANTGRWMHITPWKQDVESVDRVGLIQVMPAGDSEGDVEGRRWEQRVELMRDAIIYNRNNRASCSMRAATRRSAKSTWPSWWRFATAGTEIVDRIVVAMQAVWSLLGAAVIVWAILYENLPPLEWLNVAILGAFGLIFVFYLLALQEAG